MAKSFADSLNALTATQTQTMSLRNAVALTAEEDWITNLEYRNTKTNSLGKRYEDEHISYVDDKKNVKVNEYQVNLTQEENSQYIPFEMNRYYDGIDLMDPTMKITFYFENIEGGYAETEAINVEYNDTKIRLGFLVPKEATLVAGKLKFEIHATGVDPFGGRYLFKTKTNEDIEILESLQGNGDYIIDPGFAENVLDEVKQAASDAQYYASQAQNAYSQAQHLNTQTSTTVNDAIEEMNTKIADVEVTIKNNVVQELSVQYYTRLEIEEYVSKRLGTLTNRNDENGEGLTVEAYVAQEITNADIDNKLTAYAKTEEVNALIGDTGENEDGSKKTVVKYINDAVTAVDISDELGNLVDSEGNKLTVEEYVHQEVNAVDVSEQLENYYTKEISDEKYAPKSVETTVNTQTSEIKTINSSITAINEELATIDKTPKTKYRATYGDVELADGSTAEYMFTLWKEENGVEEVQDRFQILGGGGGSSSSVSMKIAYVDGYPQNSVFTVNDKVIIKYDYEGIDSAGDYVGGTASWKVGNKVVFTEEISSGVNEVDLTEYVGTGDNKVLLTVTHATGALATKAWTIKIVDVRLDSIFNDAFNYTANATVEFTYIPYGSIDKTVHFILDGKEIGTKKSSSSAAGLSDYYILPAQEHGTHLLEAYMTAIINEKEVESNHIFKDIIWYDKNAETAVIGCSTPELTVMQHDTVDIVFTVYDPKTETPTVTIEDNGEVIQTLPNLINRTNTYLYPASTIGKHEITLVCGDTRKPITVSVEELDINITPVTTSLAFDFNPVGYSNSSADRLWSYESEVEGETIAMTVSDNFDWTNGGYQTDNDGTYFCIKAGTTATINYRMFCAGKNIKNQGGHFKLIFKTTKVQDVTKPFLQCYKDNVGVVMQPHETNFYAGSGNKLYLAYSEEDAIEFELNMGEAIPGSEDKMVMGYEDGVATKPLVYTSGATFIQGVQNEDAEYITLGSPSCDLHIYRFKAYRKALASNEILNNFIMDARKSSEMLKRYNRNQIYREGVNDLNVAGGYSELVPEYLAEQCPDLRVILISAPRFTKSKSDKVPNTTIRCIYANGRENEDNWTVYNAMHSGQGTSSNLYGASGRNIDLIMNKKNDAGEYPWIEFADGTVLEGKDLKLNLTETSVPIDYLNIKLNIASSENANNALLARRYNQYNPYKRPLVREEGYPYVVKDTMEFQNCVVFVQETDTTQDENGNYTSHVEFNDCNWHFYGIGNVGDSKKTDNTRMNDPNDVNEFVVEVMDNNLPNSKFQSGTEDEKGYSITGHQIKAEWKTYKDDTYEMEGKYTVVTDTEKSAYLIAENLPILYELINGEYVLTSDETIVSGKTYYEKNYPNAAYAGLYKDKYYKDIESGEVELESGWGISFECRYEHDDSDHEEHRRIWNEFYEFVIFSSDEEFIANLENYCVLNSVMFYYLFTLRYTMIDNRAKNSFWHYGKCEDGKYRWDLTMDYDNDTALGIDNFGKQVYRYGYEDFDYVDSNVATDEDGNAISGNVWVFNAATSTFYNRLRLLFASRLRSLYNELDGKGAWNDEDLIAQFDAHQAQFPEELWRQDINRKYIRPYTISHINGEPDTTFLKDKMNGRKKYHRREFERSQKIYMDSKYRTEDATGNIIRLRATIPSGNLAVPVDLNLTITPYMHMYVSVDYANGVITRQMRGKPGVPLVIDYPMETGDIIAIESAPYIQSIGDISPIYTGEATFTTATRLKEILLGNSTEGYSNTSLPSLTMVKDGLLETLNIENIKSLDDELDVSTLRNLRTVLAKGSKIQGIILAKDGVVETVSVPAISILSMKNLAYLKDVDFDSLNKLDRLIIEDCNFETIDNFVINGVVYDTPNELTILNNAPNLKRVRLTDINWRLEDTSVLERLYDSSIGGYDAKGSEITNAVLSGYVYVPGIKQYDWFKYKERWTDLEIEYGSMTPQFVVTFVNDDGTVLDVQYVDQYGNAVDPTIRADNPISVPTKESTVSTDYTFNGWDRTFTNIGNNITITATYTESIRKYSVKYVQKFGSKTEVLQGEGKYYDYGTYCFYENNTPTYTAEEQYSKYYLFNRWDQSGYVDGNKVITAIYDDCYVSSDAYFNGKSLSELSNVQLYALTRLIEDKKIAITTDGSGIECVNGTNISAGDDYSFYMGHDYDYDDLSDKTHVLVDIDSPKVFSGVTGDYYDTGITLLDEDRDFVLAIDYEFASGNTSSSTLISCLDANNQRGFKLSYDTNPTIYWRNNATLYECAKGSNREMLVLRHVAGDPNLYVYTSNLSGNHVNYKVLESSINVPTDYSLIFGCGHRTKEDYNFYAKGTIYWAKLWYADLGEQACMNLASYIHENISLSISGFKRYYLENEKLSSIDFIANKTLITKKSLNSSSTNEGGWSATQLRTWLNTRFFNGMPTQLQQILKKSKVKSRAGSLSNEAVYSYDYIYIPAVAEVLKSYSISPYTVESDAVPVLIPHLTNAIMYDGNGAAVDYWTRSPSDSGSGTSKGKNYFIYINSSGSVQTVGQPSSNYGIIIEFSM